MATELPQYTAQTPGINMPDSGEAVANKIASFGNIVQNFTNKGVEYAEKQVGLKEKASEMVLKTNIDNAMRAFARSSTNQFDPKTGIQTFEQQADDYTQKLMENAQGTHADVIKAYSEHAKSTNMQPLQAAVVKQAFNETRMNFLASIDSYNKNLSQSISQIPMEQAVSHHDAIAAGNPKPKGLLEDGNIDLTDYQNAKDIDTNGIGAMLVNIDGKFTVIPKTTEAGEILSDEEALQVYQQTKNNLGIFDTQESAQAYIDKLQEPFAGQEINPKRQAPAIDSMQYQLSQVLNQIDAAGRTGVISPAQAMKLKEQVTTNTNDEMLYHKYQLAIEHGMGDQFIQSYAKANQGRKGAADYAKHIAEFRKIENRNLAEQAVTESTAREFTSDNIKNISLGKPTNTYADTIAQNAPTLFPSYNHDKQVAQLSGGIYQQLTAGTEQQAIAQVGHMQELLNNPNLSAADRASTQEAVELAVKNAHQYFTELKADPMKFVMEKNLLGDVAQQQKINEKTGVYLPDDLKTPDADTKKSAVQWQMMHGIPSNKAQLLTVAQANEFGANLLKAEPTDKVQMIQSINVQYGKYANNVMQQLIKQGGVPREYGWFTHLDPESGTLPDMVNALTNTALDYSTEQKASVKARVDRAMNISTERAHPDVSSTRRVLGMAYEASLDLVTGREYNASATNTGLFGTPALFPDNSTPDLKLKALTESMLSASGYNTGELINTIDSTVNKLTNYYVKIRGLSQDDALSQAVRSITDQYEMVDYRDNIIRLPKQEINYNDVSILLTNTPELVNKVEWQYPLRGDYGDPASRTDQINYFNQNIETGHWATDSTDQGMVWVNANGMINKMKNGNPLFISFESIQKMHKLDFSKADEHSYLNAAFDLFSKNNVSFNPIKMGVDNPDKPELKEIPNAFGTFEKKSAMAVSRTKDFYNYLFQDNVERQRKFAQRKLNAASVSKGGK
jgi:hypothetical protein